MKHTKPMTLQTRTRSRGERFCAYLKRYWPLYVLLAPMIAYMFLFDYYPMAGLQLAFKKFYPLKGIWGSPWLDDPFGVFKQLFGTSRFRGAFLNTLRISLLKFFIGFPMPIILVLLLNELTSPKFMKFVQSVSYIPHFISWVVLGGIFLSIDKSDIFQSLMSALFGKPVHFFSNSSLYLVFLIGSDIYKGIGWGTIIYLASLMNIDPQLYEAAEIDGAGRFSRMIHITLPGLLPAISINMILRLSSIMHAGFDQIYNTYNDVLQSTGETLELYLFNIGVSGGDYPVSTAMGLFNSLIGCALVIIANYTTKAIGGDGIW